MSQTLNEWISESPENARTFAQEHLIVQVAEGIWEQMERKNVSKTDIAAALGKSKAFITQLLGGSRNMTLRTLADIAFALDGEIDVQIRPKILGNGWCSAAASRTKAASDVVPVKFEVVSETKTVVKSGRVAETDSTVVFPVADAA